MTITTKKGKLVFEHGWNRRDKPRKPAVTIEDGWIVICTEWHRRRGDSCHLELSRCDTPLLLLQWVEHIAHKVWADGPLLSELITDVCQHYGWNLFGCSRSFKGTQQ